MSETHRQVLREREIIERRRRFRESVVSDPELLRDLRIGLHHAAPAKWEKFLKEDENHAPIQS